MGRHGFKMCRGAFRRRLIAGPAALAFAIALAAGTSGTASAKSSLPAGARYVAMGSSFAAGPGVTTSADTPPNRCTRSIDNYAHQLARKRHLLLTDVSCGGATTVNVLQPWGELPAQVDAVTPDTALVTVTIGGNDVGFIRELMMGSCSGGGPAAGVPAVCLAMAARRGAGSSPASSPQPSGPTEQSWAEVASRLDRIAAEVRSRAPRARLVFVEYPTVVTSGPNCANMPLAAEAMARSRSIAERLAQETAAAAHRAQADLIRTSALSRGHDACSKEPWVTGVIAPAGAASFAPYHPNLRGMTAIAHALDRRLGR